MRAVVVASLEPEHLTHCLQGLLRWLEPAQVLVFNNATRPENTERIDQTGAHFGVQVYRAHELCDGEDSIPFINGFLKAVCGQFPDEVILKLDEDAIIVSDPSRFEPERGTFLVPNITINNFTTKDYLRAFWPDLAEAVEDHGGMWHDLHPITGLDFRAELFKRLYTTHPRQLIRHCEEEGRVEYVDGQQWDAKRLHRTRGISITVIAFHARDYLDLVHDGMGVDEILIAESVHSGRMRYKVDHSIFCHHINYFSIRELAQRHRELVEAFVQRIFAHYDERVLGADHPLAVELRQAARVLAPV